MKRILVSLCVLAMMAALSFAMPAAEACEVRGVGYWKNHDTEREATIIDAAASSPAFANEQDLRFYLMLKGKKTAMQKVKRQFGAVMLNVSAGLTSTTNLNQGELELIQSFDNNYALGFTTLDDAIAEIENAISTSTTLGEAEELAESINNGDYCY